MARKRIHGLILAAGLSSRMGTFKPMLPLRGKTVIENSIDSMLLAGVEEIVVVLGYKGYVLESLFKASYMGDRLTVVYNQDYAETDMLTSIKIGLKAISPCDAFFLLPGDMPVIDKETYLSLYAAAPKDRPAITFPTLQGYRKHPPLIDSDFIQGILAYEGDQGLRGFWKLHEDSIHTLAVDDQGCSTDLDTPKQYETCIRNFSE